MSIMVLISGLVIFLGVDSQPALLVTHTMSNHHAKPRQQALKRHAALLAANSVCFLINSQTMCSKLWHRKKGA
jgi:hypothetical protein